MTCPHASSGLRSDPQRISEPQPVFPIEACLGPQCNAVHRMHFPKNITVFGITFVHTLTHLAVTKMKLNNYGYTPRAIISDMIVSTQSKYSIIVNNYTQKIVKENKLKVLIPLIHEATDMHGTHS